jgi:hypothetical protein
MKLTINFHLIPWLRMSGVIPLLPLCLHSVHKDNFAFAFKDKSTAKYEQTYSLFLSSSVSFGNAKPGTETLLHMLE